MKKFIKSKLALQVIASTVIASFAIAGVISASTTIGTNMATTGTLEVTGVSTLTGAVSAGGAVTVTGATALNGGLTMDSTKFTVADSTGNTAIAGTLAVTGATTFTGALGFGTASSTAGGASTLKAANILSDTTAISFGNENLTTTGAINFATASSTSTAALDSLTVGGGYGSTGTTISTAGVIQTNGAVTLGSTLAVTGTSAFTGTLGFGTASSTAGGASTLKAANILSDTTAISFGNENLTTTGTLGAGATILSGLLNFTTASSTAGSGSQIKVANILSDTTAISFGDENLTTTGTFGAGAITGTGLTVNGNAAVTGNLTVGGNFTLGDAAADTLTVYGATILPSLTATSSTPFVLEGATDNGFETTIAVTDPTADNTITLPNGTGTVYITGGTDVTVADGGTGLSSYTAGDLIYASAATTLAKLASSTDATILMTDANGWPSWKVMSGDTTISDTGVVTIASNAVAGTDILLASEAAGDMMYSNGTDWVRLASSTDATILMTNANGWPAWNAMTGDATISDAGVVTIAGNSIDGTMLALGSDAAGDLMTYNGTDWARLASSTDATIMMINANGYPTWNAMTGDATISDAGALTIASNAVAGTDILLASEAAGDMMYSNGTDWVRLASSTDGFVLTLDANGWPSWANAVGTTGAENTWTDNQIYTFAAEENIAINSAASAAVDILKLNITSTSVDAIRGIVIDGLVGGTEPVDAGIQIIGSDTDAGDLMASGLILTGTITTAVDASDANIVTALKVDANDIVGTTGLINYTNFDVDAAGNITVAAAQGLDTNAAGALKLGVTTANAVTISKDTVMTTVEGTLNVDEAVTLDTTLAVTGDVTVDTSVFKVNTSTNRVGVGTTTPQALLHLDSGATATSTIAIGDRVSGTGKSCFDLVNSAGAAVRMYINGTTMLIETGTCN